MAGSRLIALLGAAVSACSPALPAGVPASSAPVAGAAPGPVPLSPENWEVVRSSRHGLEVPLPDRGAWAVNDVSEPWLVAQHADSRSEVRLRSWRAPRTNGPQACAEQVRLWRPDLPAPTGGAVLERRGLTSPGEYRGEVLVGAAAGADGVEGFVVVVGARVGRCFAFWYRTRIRGAGADRIVGENLAVVSAGMVDRIVELEVDQVVPRESVSP